MHFGCVFGLPWLTFDRVGSFDGSSVLFGSLGPVLFDLFSGGSFDLFGLWFPCFRVPCSDLNLWWLVYAIGAWSERTFCRYL
jgi:hypothetical protein